MAIIIRCYSISLSASINTIIVQRSGIGLMLYAVMEKDLYTISLVNMLIKYAHDTNLLVPSDFEVGLTEEFSHVKHWADENR